MRYHKHDTTDEVAEHSIPTKVNLLFNKNVFEQSTKIEIVDENKSCMRDMCCVVLCVLCVF